MISTIALGLKNVYLRGLKYYKVSSDPKKLFGLTIEGPQVDFYKNDKFIP